MFYKYEGKILEKGKIAEVLGLIFTMNYLKLKTKLDLIGPFLDILAHVLK